MRLGAGFGLRDAARQLVGGSVRRAAPPGKPQLSGRCPSALILASPSGPPEPGGLLVRGSAFCSRLRTLGMRAGSLASSHLDSWCQSRHCPGWRGERMNAQRSNGTGCVQVPGRRRCAAHTRTGRYRLYSCRAGALPGPGRELRAPLETEAGRQKGARAGGLRPRKQRLRWHWCEVFTRERPCQQTPGGRGRKWAQPRGRGCDAGGP